MADSLFREPKMARRGGRGYHFTEEEREARLKHFEKIGRRCEGQNRQCFFNRATRRLVVYRLDDETGARVGDPQTILTCSRHRGFWEKSPRYEVISSESLVEKS